ncbi:T9SS type A sorting domain-containing protein [Hymenobacter sp. DH14]|uniref:T9SS type A sorting domain-containing protein n=1 Tax=Hymenobacter cyanobacteriorum TaxID=2926463 RepID=A0A9X2AGI4_9BACT|nr:T9SS type A sorting domain-containing protein [Hymenobacter cyanobacteriorum]MCI1186355.1 T9SS type A sorting domain-containing protein [Hymenobacter cyanobacteriorum]
MMQTFTSSLGMAALLCLSAATASHAQYTFADAPTTASAGLGAYRQNFDGLAGTNTYFQSNNTLPGVYARYTLNVVGGEYESYQRGWGTSARLSPDNGSEGTASQSSVDNNGTAHGPAWYHFGSAGSPDRALGGIAGTATWDGQGYVGIRLKNGSTKVITNLEVEYAMEQWYNSSRTQAATVTVEYRRSTAAITSVFDGRWTAISALNVAAPSTSAAIAPRDGNAATNRRVMHTTLSGLNLRVGEEIMLRFGYAFNSASNGNGLSIDDVVITPQTNIFYSADDDSKKLDSKSSWGTNTDGTGTAPANFAADNCTYYVQCKNKKAKRLTSGTTWVITGLNSKIIVGDGSKKSTLYVGPNDDIQGTIDVSDQATLEIEHLANTLTLGSLHDGSTVEYINAGTMAQRISAGSYGNLALADDGPRTLAGPVLVRSGLAYEKPATASVLLNNYDLQLQKDADFSGPARTAPLLVTNGTGSLVRTVSGDGVGVLFPVGASATSYTPATLSQSGSGLEDAYSVRVIDNMYASYTAAGIGVGTPITNQNVKKTWLVEEEVPGNSNVTMTLQWPAAEAASNFLSTKAHISHYTNGTWDTTPLASASGAGAGANKVSRAGIRSFSPFGVSSRANPLPVELTAFTARRVSAAVACAWTTASERNSHDFAVERSRDGEIFETLGTVAAAGTSSSATVYGFRDQQPLPGRAYYRLRQTDVDGAVAYSPLVLVAGAEVAAPTVVPNPGTGAFALLLPEGLALTGPVVVRNVLGAEVLRLPAAATADAVRFELGGQPAGVYLVQLETAAGRRCLRIIKQ